MIIKLGMGWIPEPDDYVRAATPAEYVAEIERLLAIESEAIKAVETVAAGCDPEKAISGLLTVLCLNQQERQ